MSKLIIFYLEHCPYCQNAKKAVKELANEIPPNVELEWIEESLHPDIADQYDYYYVPSIFKNGKKLYECSPADNYEAIKCHFQQALKET